MEAPVPPYIHHLLRQDFSRTCAQVRYCFTCEAAFCLDCCPGHSAWHHPGHPGCRILSLLLFPHKSIRRNILPAYLSIYCLNCHDRMYARGLYCCAHCRIQHVVTGGGRSKVTALVQTQFSQQAVMDRFCTLCSRTFSSSCCPGPDHLAGHHPGENGAVVRLVRHRGSILAPVVDLVGFSQQNLAGIETVMLNGIAMVPLCRSEGHLDPEGEPGNICVKCFKVIGINSSYCCVNCRVDDI